MERAREGHSPHPFNDLFTFCIRGSREVIGEDELKAMKEDD
jgi:hypothetical protein